MEEGPVGMEVLEVSVDVYLQLRRSTLEIVGSGLLVLGGAP